MRKNVTQPGPAKLIFFFLVQSFTILIARKVIQYANTSSYIHTFGVEVFFSMSSLSNICVQVRPRCVNQYSQSV